RTGASLPTGAANGDWLGRGRLVLLVALTEALDATGLVDDALLAREERVAVRADVEVHLPVGGAGLDRGARLPLVPAAVAVEHAQLVDGVDSCLHGSFLSLRSSNAAGTFRWPETWGARPHTGPRRSKRRNSMPQGTIELKPQAGARGRMSRRFQTSAPCTA